MKHELFTNKDLRKLILPLFVEQFLLMFVGITDTFTVGFSSEADVSGVSLVTSFNTVLIFLFYGISVRRRCNHQPIYRQQKRKRSFSFFRTAAYNFRSIFCCTKCRYELRCCTSFSAKLSLMSCQPAKLIS